MTQVEQIARIVAVLTKHYGSPHHEDTAEDIHTEVIRPLEEERDRLRASLERIAASKLDDMHSLHPSACATFARATLSQEPQG